MTPRLLIHTRTADYRHDSIPEAVEALCGLREFTVEHTEDPAALERSLDGFAAVVLLSTSGEVLTPAGRERLAAYVEGGGGFAGVHAAACAEYGWPYYGELLGARFDRHPEFQPGTALVADPDHPATRHLPAAWHVTGEWYDFRSPPARGCGCCCGPTRRRTGAARWEPTAPSPGAADREPDGCSPRPSDTRQRPTATRTS